MLDRIRPAFAGEDVTLLRSNLGAEQKAHLRDLFAEDTETEPATSAVSPTDTVPA